MRTWIQFLLKQIIFSLHVSQVDPEHESWTWLLVRVQGRQRSVHRDSICEFGGCIVQSTHLQLACLTTAPKVRPILEPHISQDSFFFCNAAQPTPQTQLQQQETVNDYYIYCRLSVIQVFFTLCCSTSCFSSNCLEHGSCVVEELHTDLCCVCGGGGGGWKPSTDQTASFNSIL